MRLTVSAARVVAALLEAMPEATDKVAGHRLRAELDEWGHGHFECGPDCVVTGDNCSDDLIEA